MFLPSSTTCAPTRHHDSVVKTFTAFIGPHLQTLFLHNHHFSSRSGSKQSAKQCASNFHPSHPSPQLPPFALPQATTQWPTRRDRRCSGQKTTKPTADRTQATTTTSRILPSPSQHRSSRGPTPPFTMAATNTMVPTTPPPPGLDVAPSRRPRRQEDDGPPSSP